MVGGSVSILLFIIYLFCGGMKRGGCKYNKTIGRFFLLWADFWRVFINRFMAASKILGEDSARVNSNVTSTHNTAAAVGANANVNAMAEPEPEAERGG